MVMFHGYPLETNMAMESLDFSWVNQREMPSFNGYVKLPEGNSPCCVFFVKATSLMATPRKPSVSGLALFNG